MWKCDIASPIHLFLYKWVMISFGKRKEPAGVWTAVSHRQTPGFWEYFSPDEKQTDMVSDRLKSFLNIKDIPSIVHLNLLQGFVNKCYKMLQPSFEVSHLIQMLF